METNNSKQNYSESEITEATATTEEFSLQEEAPSPTTLVGATLLDSDIAFDGERFIEELESLCRRHNMSIFSSTLGLRFIPRDADGVNIKDPDNFAGMYWVQSFGDKHFNPLLPKTQS